MGGLALKGGVGNLLIGPGYLLVLVFFCSIEPFFFLPRWWQCPPRRRSHGSPWGRQPVFPQSWGMYGYKLLLCYISYLTAAFAMAAVILLVGSVRPSLGSPRGPSSRSSSMASMFSIPPCSVQLAVQGLVEPYIHLHEFSSICIDFPQFESIWPNLHQYPQFASVYPNLHQLTPICINLLKFASIYPNLPRFASMFPNFPQFTPICINFPKFASIFPNLHQYPQFASIYSCGPILTHSVKVGYQSSCKEHTKLNVGRDGSLNHLTTRAPLTERC